MRETRKPDRPAVGGRARPDLGGRLPAEASLPVRAGESSPAGLAPEEEERERIVAVMAGAERKGEWEPAARISVFAFWGGVMLDFRKAVLLEGETVVECAAIMGGVEILVPKDIDVEVEGSGIMGGFTHLSQDTGDEEAPLLRIKGLALMGGVEVKVK